MNHLSVSLQRLRPNALLPAYASEEAAGMDLFAALEEPVTLLPGTRTRIPCGFAMAPERNDVAGLIFARSGLAHKLGLAPSNAVGVVDADYRGEVMVSLANSGSEPYTLRPGERFAQLVFVPVLRAELREIGEGETLNPTERGSGGFGSTGSFSPEQAST